MTIRLVGWSRFSHMVSTGPMDRRSDIAHSQHLVVRCSFAPGSRGWVGPEVTFLNGSDYLPGTLRLTAQWPWERPSGSATADEPAPDRLDPLCHLSGVGLVQGRPAAALAQVGVDDGVRGAGLARIGGHQRVELLAGGGHGTVGGQLGVDLPA